MLYKSVVHILFSLYVDKFDYHEQLIYVGITSKRRALVQIHYTHTDLLEHIYFYGYGLKLMETQKCAAEKFRFSNFSVFYEVFFPLSILF